MQAQKLARDYSDVQNPMAAASWRKNPDRNMTWTMTATQQASKVAVATMIEEQRQLASALGEKNPHGYSQLKFSTELDRHAACTVMKVHQVQSRIADGRRMLMMHHGRYDETTKL